MAVVYLDLSRVIKCGGPLSIVVRVPDLVQHSHNLIGTSSSVQFNSTKRGLNYRLVPASSVAGY